MKQYAGIDVSLVYSSVCVVDADGCIVREAKVLSEPDALIAWFGEDGVAWPWNELVLKPVRCRNGAKDTAAAPPRAMPTAIVRDLRSSGASLPTASFSSRKMSHDA